MVPGGVTEIIWHFAGYFHQFAETPKDRVNYEDGVIRPRPDDYVVNLNENVVKPSLDDFYTAKIPSSASSAADAPQLDNLTTVPLRALRPIAETDIEADGGGRIPAIPRPAVTAPVGVVEDISLTYRDGGDQMLLEIRQINTMDDDDQLLVLAKSEATELHDIDIDATLTSLIAAAENHGPDSLAIPYSGTSTAADFLAARDIGIAESGGSDGAHTVDPGRYVNGELQPESEPTPAPAAEEPPSSDLAAKGQWAELGGNSATNAALIVDVMEATNTMIVLGDFFQTNAIIQTNSYIDNDHISVAGGEFAVQIAGGDNKADNIAEFVQHEGIFSSVPAMFSGMNWNVDVVDGNFYDINLVYQRNFLRDNDVAVQETQHSHYEVRLGENEQLNLTQIYAGSVKYDLIVIGGSFHGANFIFQHNIILDSDIVKIAANEQAGDTPTQSAATGANTLLNDATIVSYGDNVFSAPDENLDDLLTALSNRSATIAPHLGWLIPGNGSDILNVLYVTGDYYDINAIWQINIISDVDTAIQLLSEPQPKAGEELTQSASTGSNTATNEAVIVDVGSTSSLVAGGVYHDTILIQANLVSENNDKIVYSDPNKLVSEIIAFTGDDASGTNGTDLIETANTLAHNDPIGSLLT